MVLFWAWPGPSLPAQCVSAALLSWHTSWMLFEVNLVVLECGWKDSIFSMKVSLHSTMNGLSTFS